MALNVCLRYRFILIVIRVKKKRCVRRTTWRVVIIIICVLKRCRRPAGGDACFGPDRCRWNAQDGCGPGTPTRIAHNSWYDRRCIGTRISLTRTMDAGSWDPDPVIRLQYFISTLFHNSCHFERFDTLKVLLLLFL